MLNSSLELNLLKTYTDDLRNTLFEGFKLLTYLSINISYFFVFLYSNFYSMKKYTILIIFFILFSCKEEAEKKDIVYLSPDCECCHEWISHMESNNFLLEKNMDSNMYDVKINAGLPIDLASCHTAIINGYFIEGHVPASDVKKLIKENPENIIGLTVPGMPAGINVPGMEVNNEKANFDVLAVDINGESSVWSHYE